MLENGQIQAIFASPEMCLQHPEFRAYLSEASPAQGICMVVLGEAHCISQAANSAKIMPTPTVSAHFSIPVFHS